tara:strand:+ start:576 stop:1145 length:570 start_codon:yes stop_codon:yes gene_type:complete
MSRKQQILECLAGMLETSPGERITTARLAAEVGVSEAALYRHFPSKARMFEGLIDFVEEAIFSRINRIIAEEDSVAERCQHMMLLILTFAERNPGISRILTGEALSGEKERLRERINRLYERIELQFKQVLREQALREGAEATGDVSAMANLLLAIAEGRIQHFVRSGFRCKPTAHWTEQWALIRGVFS